MDTASVEKKLLDWVLQRYPDTPKTRAKQWIQAGRVSVGGVVRRKAGELLTDPGNTLELSQRRAPTLDCGSGWRIHPRVRLVFLDVALAVVSKGPGLISVPAPDGKISALSILEDFLAGKLVTPVAKTLPPSFRKLHPLPVHRLDQYTSGLFCIALNPAARSSLIEQVRAHTMGRQYVAFVQGRAPRPEGTWKHWLLFNRDQMRQKIVAPGSGGGAKEAVTHYEVIDEYPVGATQQMVTKLRLRLETGLQHQIRAQAAQAGLPLIGDRVYNPPYRDPRHPTGPVPFSRQALHSERLSLQHPEQPGKNLSWKADLPEDLQQLETVLRAGRV